MRIVNPYSGIDFATAKKVVGISHEHIYSTQRLKNAYNRGIRWFACVNYTPAVPAAPSLSGWSGTYQIWNYFDVSYAYPTGGEGGTDIYTSANARAAVPVQSGLRQSGLVISYKTSGGRVYEKFTGETWSTTSGWSVINEADLDAELVLKNATYSQSCQDFIADNSDEVDVSELPALGNAEHSFLRGDNGQLVALHFNVLGNMWSEPCAVMPLGYPRTFIEAHPIYALADIETLFTQDPQFAGKWFGTINHSYDTRLIKKYIAAAPSLFKGMELFNQGATKERNQMFRDAYDELLREGYRLWVLSVADWPEDIEGTGYPGQDMEHYVKECDFVRGCNVLYMPSGYDAMTKAGKTEAGLDSYLAGKYFASGTGAHSITGLSVDGNKISFSVDGTPSKLKVITSARVLEFTNRNNAAIVIEPGETYVRFEAYYYGDSTDMDFIFTNPFWVEDNGLNDSAAFLLLLS